MNTASSAGSEDRVNDLPEVATDNDQQQFGQDLENATDDKHDDAAESSTEADAKGAKQPEEDTLEAVVRRAAKKSDASKGAEGTPPDGKSGEDEAVAAEPETDEKSGEGKDADVPFHKHPRWQELLRERDGYKQQVESLKEKAERFDAIGAFAQQHGLTADELNQGFQIMALMKNDPQKALELLAPHLANLELATGRRLPEDLQADVENGLITAERAQELARIRLEAQTHRQRAERTEAEIRAEREREQQREQQRQAAEAARAMQGAVTQWEESIKQRDPDYSHKQRFVTDRVRALMAERGRPQNAEEAVALVKEAYDDVTRQMRAILPKREQVRTVTSEQSSTRAAPAPKTMEEAIRAAMRK